ncbi:hypothetical protein HYH02_002916 [Chlamydomonas schloesseri]|uniref:Uncharacterized protein n=1 Tax=Chlamydomonas schloesseri TaxID=2026947 RepID=A0A835WRB9_9CHLO|nr:hypothetical protein HYH02_002916 [Chlamydomonas schloesseri]|eukprot:KAG2452684.1 hypothetical protein HYH02_002916 [Chlamydomonas schloesseri]
MARRGLLYRNVICAVLAVLSFNCWGSAVDTTSVQKNVVPALDQDATHALTPDDKACELPHEWCRSPGAVLKRADCDGDEIADWVCLEPASSDAAATAGGTGSSSGPAAGGGGAGAGVRSVVRLGAGGDRRGAITSGKGCDSAASGWPNAPKKLCPKVFGGPDECEQPEDWCIHPAMRLDRVDCDADGVLDLVCSDGEGNRSLLRSSSSPPCDSEQDGWSLAPLEWCPQYFVDVRVCPRPGWWCNDTYAVLEQADCDGDLIKDWVCSDDRGRRGAIVSSQNCGAWDGATGWPDAPASYCPSYFKGKPCLRPEWWCESADDELSMYDCDEDGTLDFVCVNKVRGQRGVLLSDFRCNPFNNGTGWPNAPESMCLGFFEEEAAKKGATLPDTAAVAKD